MADLPQDLQKLDERINSLKARNEKKTIKTDTIRKYNIGIQTITDFIAPIFIGLCIGYLIDKFCSTMPIFIIIFAFFGFAAGILNIYKLYNGINNGTQE